MPGDVRLALRLLSRQPAFTAAAVLTLALGIGANTAMFSVAYGVLWRPLPFPEHERIVRLFETHPGANAPLRGAWFSNFAYHAWQPSHRTIGPIANFAHRVVSLGDERPERVPAGSVAPVLFDVLGARPLAGRFFAAGDAAEGAPPVAVVTAGFWRERIGDGPFEPGRTIVVDERTHEIVGVAPETLDFPSDDVRLWTVAAEPTQTGIAVFGAIARLVPGATADQASAEGTSAARNGDRPLTANMLFGEGGPVVVHAEPLAAEMTAAIRPALLVLLLAAGCLLAIACANVANLLLSRGITRRREIAVRSALGAGRWQIVRQLTLEAAVLAAAGGLAGTGLAWALLAALPSAAPADFPRLDAVRLDTVAIGAAFAATAATVVLSGLLPAWRTGRGSLSSELTEDAGASAGRQTAGVRRALLAGEAALAVVLLVAAVLLGRSFVRLTDVDGGFEPDGVLTAVVRLPGAVAEGGSEPFLRDLLDRLRQRPGVVAAGAGNMAPFSPATAIAGFPVAVPGRERQTARALIYVVTPGYAEALGLRLKAGRWLDDRDLTAASRAMIVNEAFVDTYLSGVDPVGLRFDDMLGDGAAVEVVGVAANVLKDGLDRAPQPSIHVVPERGSGIRGDITLAVRTSGAPEAFADQLREEVWGLEPGASIDRVRSLDSLLAGSVARPRFAGAVLGGFAVLALTLAALGLYSVLSYSISRRRRELGIRVALGATRRDIVVLVVREGMVVAIAGLLVGAAAAMAVTRWMQALLFGVTPLDGPSFVLAPLALAVVSLAACWLPARRAARHDPVAALKDR